jgi:hypothetical protein
VQKGTVFKQSDQYCRQLPIKKQKISINAPKIHQHKTQQKPTQQFTNRYVWTAGYTDIAKAIFTNVPSGK